MRYLEKDESTINVENAEGCPNTKAVIIHENSIDYVPNVSVIIPVYNSEEYLRKCLDSVINQTLTKIEIICVDDGSTDSSLKILKEYAMYDNRLTVVAQKNLYAGVARNAGLELAKGEYLMFLDSDDWFESQMLYEMYNKALISNSDIVVCKAREFDVAKNEFKEALFPVSEKFFPKNLFNPVENFGEYLFQANSSIAWNKLIRRDLIEKTNIRCGMTKNSTDTIFIYTILTQANSITLLNKIFINYRVGNPNSLQRSKSLAWECVCFAFYDLKKELIKRNVYKQHKKSFVNKALQSCIYYLNTIDYDLRPLMAKALQKKWFKLLDIKGCSKKYIYNKSLYIAYKDIMKNKFDIFAISRKEVVVSLTSYPARISTVHLTIESLLKQTCIPNKIILWLAYEQFPNKEQELPRELLDLRGELFEIAWCSDIRSYKKLIPTLRKYPNKVIITMDDDVVYDYNCIERLLVTHLKNKNKIICHRGHCIAFNKNGMLPYKNWNHCTDYKKATTNILATGVGGILYPQKCFYKDVLNQELFKRLSYDTDDIWFWAMAILNNTKIMIAKDNITNVKYIENTQEAGLWHKNFEGSGNDVNMEKILDYYPLLRKKTKYNYFSDCILNKLFSVNYTKDKRYKILFILGIKIKFKRKEKEKKEKNRFIENIFSIKNSGNRKVVTIFGFKIKFKITKIRLCNILKLH